MTTYDDFIADKAQSVGNHGFAPTSTPPYLYDFQAALVDWALRKGRAAIFADCGLGKTPMQLAWADAVVKRENRPVLILTPLAVCGQTMREGEKFGVECRRPGGGGELQRTPVPKDILKFRGHPGKQTENRYSQWVWRQYASAFWDDVRLNRVLPFQDCKEQDDEKHVHPLQLDVIDRIVALWSNPGETVFTPFMGVGSEVYSAVRAGRKGIGAELKTSYFRQAIANLQAAETEAGVETSPQNNLFESEHLEGEAEGRGASRRPGIKESGVLTAK